MLTEVFAQKSKDLVPPTHVNVKDVSLVTIVSRQFSHRVSPARVRMEVYVTWSWVSALPTHVHALKDTRASIVKQL